MIDLLLTIIINSAVCIGIHAAFQYKFDLVENKFEFKMILGGFAYWMDRNLPEFFQKPIYSCPACMATLYSPLVWFYFLGLPFDPMYFAAWIGTAGVNWFVAQNYNV